MHKIPSACVHRGTRQSKRMTASSRKPAAKLETSASTASLYDAKDRTDRSKFDNCKRSLPGSGAATRASTRGEDQHVLSYQQIASPRIAEGDEPLKISESFPSLTLLAISRPIRHCVRLLRRLNLFSEDADHSGSLSAAQEGRSCG